VALINIDSADGVRDFGGQPAAHCRQQIRMAARVRDAIATQPASSRLTSQANSATQPIIYLEF
jgi:hypothetical protein